MVKNSEHFELQFSIIKGCASVAPGRYEEAIRTVNSIKDKDPDRNTLVILNVCQRKQGNEAQFKATMSKWKQVDPKDSSLYIFIVQYYIKQGSRDKAAQHAAVVAHDAAKHDLAMEYIEKAAQHKLDQRVWQQPIRLKTKWSW